MALKKKLTSAPEATIQALYKKISDHEWVLDLEEESTDTSGHNQRLAEFRENNIRLLRENEEVKKRLADLEAKSAPLISEKKGAEDRIAILEKKYEEETKARTLAEQRARQENFKSGFMNHLQRHKVRDDKAGSLLHSLALQTFKEKEGSFVPVDEQGNTIYSKKTAQPLSVEEWIEERKSSDYKDLFLQPTGGSARGSSGLSGTGSILELTREQAQRPNAEQFKAMSEGRVKIVDS